MKAARISFWQSQAQHQGRLTAEVVEATEVPRIACNNCGQPMRFVGMERHPENRKAALLTFECAQGHLATTTFPN